MIFLLSFPNGQLEAPRHPHSLRQQAEPFFLSMEGHNKPAHNKSAQLKQLSAAQSQCSRENNRLDTALDDSSKNEVKASMALQGLLELAQLGEFVPLVRCHSSALF